MKICAAAAFCFLSAASFAAVDNQFQFKIKNELGIEISMNYNYGCPDAVSSDCYPYRPPQTGNSKAIGSGTEQLGQSIVPPNTTISVTKTIPSPLAKDAEHSYAQDLAIWDNPNFEGGKEFHPLCFARYGETMDVYGSYIIVKGVKTLYQIHCTEETN